MNSIHTLDTPSLLLNLNQLENNLNEIRDIAKQNGIEWRPHIKTHKSVNIAKMQLEKGACGITVAKLEEAEVMAAAHISNILIAYPLAQPKKLERLKKLSSQTKVILAIDSFEQAEIVNTIFSGCSEPLEVWIKVNSGLNRCGIEMEEIVELAQKIKTMKPLALTGIFTHAGHSYAASSQEQIEKIAEDEANSVIQSAELCEQAGIPIQHRSVGSTPTFKYGAKIKGITEIRPGNAAFYDMCQVGLGVAETKQCALTVLASVVSKKKDRIIFDTGSKALSLDQGAHGNKSVVGYGRVINHPEITIERLSEEHGVASFKDTLLEMNDTVEIIPNHSCVVANLFEEYIVHRDGEVVERWKVEARGMMK
ncbi:alanine racemase [Alkalihalobacterium chitinilyticum]|uniref:Alanine racemase n=1 Tax=Alkalihalobacterium chitinilyticum TaxID=2980103 RepID=A0ABT5VDB4_9BACI|nr:alanine racemase [Alkalihalobacterium chitinilyticum]MDE5413449.1 alanine racemase [Alkalihalobacterium chitinilyticum]